MTQTSTNVITRALLNVQNHEAKNGHQIDKNLSTVRKTTIQAETCCEHSMRNIDNLQDTLEMCINSNPVRKRIHALNALM